jgi:hypothetical protein
MSAYRPSQLSAAPGPAVNIDIPTLTPEQQKRADRAFEIESLRMKVPMVLNLPVSIAQLPYVIPSSSKREWVPRGMTTDTWRAITWPFAGVLFWWLAGRGVEAFLASRRKVVSPRLTLPETVFAAIFVCLGVVIVAGTVTSTAEDWRDLQLLPFVGSGVIWGVLSGLTIAARISQWKIRRQAQLAV